MSDKPIYIWMNSSSGGIVEVLNWKTSTKKKEKNVETGGRGRRLTHFPPSYFASPASPNVKPLWCKNNLFNHIEKAAVTRTTSFSPLSLTFPSPPLLQRAAHVHSLWPRHKSRYPFMLRSSATPTKLWTQVAVSAVTSSQRRKKGQTRMSVEDS